MPMLRRSRAFRLLAMLGMVVQLVLPATLAIADARLQRADGAATAHVEDHGSPACHPVHTDDCALCRTLTHLSAPRAEAPSIEIRRFATRNGIARAIASRASSPWFGPPPSRAPPA